MGGAVGTDVAFAIYVPAHFLICRRLLGIEFGQVGLTLVRLLLAATAMSGVLLVFGTGTVSVAILLTGAVAGGLVFVAVLLVSGEVSWTEVAAVRSRFRRRA